MPPEESRDLSFNRSSLRWSFSLAGILVLAGFLRFSGLNWDENSHLHPDERFLTMVTTALEWPSNLSEYLDESRSPLNPRNRGYTFFAYGTLPTTLVRGAIEILDVSDFDRAAIVGRFLSAGFAVATVLLLFFLARFLYRDTRIAILASFLYSVAVLPIQHAHFFVAESFLVFFSLLTLYWFVRIQREGRRSHYLLAGASLAFALACKISAAEMVPVLVLVAVIGLQRGGSRPGGSLRETGVSILWFGLAVLITFRFLQPDAFYPSWVPWPSERWLSNLREVGRMVSGEIDFPPGLQWIGRTDFWFPLKNSVLWGLGVPLGLTACLGFVAAGWRLSRRGETRHLVPVATVAVGFLIHGSAWVKPSRYLLPLYPLLALLAAWAVIRLLSRLLGANRALRTRWVRSAAAGLVLLTIAGGTTLWAFAFTSIYRRPHTRVEASRWIFQNIPPGSVLGVEHWDDGLPLRLDGNDPASTYRFQQMSWYDPDSPEKRDRALEWLERTDYIILSSNRLYDSIPRLPLRYPMTIAYYSNLRGGTLGYERVAEFTSYPGLFGLEISDGSAEEPFTVYDHPKVEIYARTPAYSTAVAREIFSAVDWASIVPATARQYHEAPDLLQFPPGVFAVYQQKSNAMGLPDSGGFALRHPVLAWILCLELFALIGIPWVLLVSRSLPDLGVGVARLLGWLLSGWIVWILGSTRLFRFAPGTIWPVLLLLAGLSLFLLVRHWTDFSGSLSASLPAVVVADALFWAAFALMLLVRSGNPDLWHPTLGGEKPMDFSYLNAVIRSPYFPPFDPWFAGGYLNYYYFGYVLVGVIVLVTGVIPEVGYNLALATFFGLAASASFSAGLALLGRRGKPDGKPALGMALAGCALVCLLGNPGIIRVVAEPLRSLSRLSFSSTIPGLESIVRSVDGLIRLIVSGGPLAVRPEAWYWQPTRLISHPPSEAGPINEFPWFTYLFGDLHPHAMSLPLVLAVAGLSTILFRDPLRGNTRKILLAFWLGLLIGAVWMTNTWDLPACGILVLSGLWLAPRRQGSSDSSFRFAAGAGILLLGYALGLPYHIWSRSGYGVFSLWQGSRTSLSDFTLIHGLFLLVLISGVVSEYRFSPDPNVFVRLGRIVARHWRSLPRLMSLLRRIDWPDSTRIGLGISAAGVLGSLLLFSEGLLLPGALVLLLLAVALLYSRRAPRTWQWTLLLTIVGSALLLLVEFVVLEGDISRMNTVFKFYFQSWWLWSLAAVGWLVRLRATGKWGYPIWTLWRISLGILVLAAGTTSLVSTFARIRDRFDPDLPPTLNGAAFMRTAVYAYGETRIPLEEDLEAIEWLRRNVSGAPVILEANTHPRLYAWGNRYSMFTGFPSVVGWHWHQQQQRSVLPSSLVFDRVRDVREIYETQDEERAVELLRRYRVEWIVVGGLERLHYAAEGLAKFPRLGRRGIVLAYSNPGVQVYRVESSP